MDRSSSRFMLDNVVVCNSCQKSMAYTVLSGGVRTGYVCRSLECSSRAEINEDVVVEVINASMEQILSLSGYDQIYRDLAFRMLDESPEVVSKWLSEHFRIYVSASITGGVIEMVEYI